MVMADAPLRRAYAEHTVAGKFNYRFFVAELKRELEGIEAEWLEVSETVESLEAELAG